MAEYIEREVALEVAKKSHLYFDIKPIINSIPAVNVRGEWRGIGKNGRIFVCSACDKTFPYKTRYCPNCGAWMEED